MIRQRKGQHEKDTGEDKEGRLHAECRVDGEMKILGEDEIKLEKTFKHTIEIVVRQDKGQGRRYRAGWRRPVSWPSVHGDGLVQVIVDKNGEGPEEKTFSTSLACPEHGVSIEELEPRMFSFNNPMGACPECNGLGFIQSIDPDLIIPDTDKSINEKCLSNVFATMEYTSYLLAGHTGTWQKNTALSLDTPYKDLPEEVQASAPVRYRR